VAAF